MLYYGSGLSLKLRLRAIQSPTPNLRPCPLDTVSSTTPSILFKAGYLLYVFTGYIVELYDEKWTVFQDWDHE